MFNFLIGIQNYEKLPTAASSSKNQHTQSFRWSNVPSFTLPKLPSIFDKILYLHLS
jgi:hypothetical protein